MCPQHAYGLLALPDVETKGERQVQAVLLEGVFEGRVQTPAHWGLSSQTYPHWPSHAVNCFSSFVIFGSVRRGMKQKKQKDVFYTGQKLPPSSNTEIMWEFNPP